MGPWDSSGWGNMGTYLDKVHVGVGALMERVFIYFTNYIPLK